MNEYRPSPLTVPVNLAARWRGRPQQGPAQYVLASWPCADPDRRGRRPLYRHQLRHAAQPGLSAIVFLGARHDVRHREEQEQLARRGPAAGLHVLHGRSVAPAGLRDGHEQRLAGHDGLRRHRDRVRHHGHWPRPSSAICRACRSSCSWAPWSWSPRWPTSSCTARADADHLRDGHRDLLGLHAGGPAARGQRREVPVHAPWSSGRRAGQHLPATAR